MGIAPEDLELPEGGEGRTVRQSALERPTEAEQRLNQTLDMMAEEGEALKAELYDEWDKNIMFFEGRQWESPRPDPLTTVTVNNIYRILIQEAALLADYSPTYIIKARDSDKWGALAAVLATIAEAIWQMRGHGALIPQAALDLAAFNKSFWKVLWKPELAWGLGDISIERVDPGEVSVDNVASLEEASFIRHRQVMPVWKARQMFPAFADRIVADDSVTMPTSLQRDAYLRLPRPRTRVGERKGAVERVIVEEWLIRDPTMDEAGKAKYPSGRLITRVGEAAKVIVQDIKYPWYDPWPGPWVEMTGPRIRGFWGVPEISQSRSLQELLNVLFSILADQGRLQGSGIWIVDDQALRPDALEILKTQTSGVVTKKPGTEVRREAGAPIGEGMLEYTRMVNQAMEFIHGLLDTSYGRVPRGVTAGAAIEALQQGTAALVRLRSGEIQRALQKAGQMVVARVLQFYTNKRIFFLTGQDGRIIDTVFDPEKLGLLDAEEGIDELVKQFTIAVQSGSELALSKEKGYALHTALYGMGAIDRKALLDALEYPNREEIIERMNLNMTLGLNPGAAGPSIRGRGSKIIESAIDRGVI